MVGLPGAGKTTRARDLARAHSVLCLTPDEWMLPLFGSLELPGRERDVVLDLGPWGREERSALRALAEAQGAGYEAVHLPVDRTVQPGRVARRWREGPGTTQTMGEAEVDRWRAQFQEPDAAELAGSVCPVPLVLERWASWQRWAQERWPSLEVP